MKLKEFIETFVEANTLIRLWTTVEGIGHEYVVGPHMEWEYLKSDYVECDVVGVTDILVSDNYKEAVNIVIRDISAEVLSKRIFHLQKTKHLYADSNA